MAVQTIEIPGNILQVVETPPPVTQVVSGGGSSSSGGSGITSLNGQTSAAQTFSTSNDTNVTLAVASGSGNHAFTLGFTGQLALSRGGTGASDATGARTNLGLGALAVLNTVGSSQIDNDAVTYAKIQNVTDNRLVGRSAGSAGDLMEILIGPGLQLSAGTLSSTGSGGTVTNFAFTNANGISGSVLNPTTTPVLTLSLGAITPSSVAATGPVSGSNLSGTNTGDQTITLTGPVTGSGSGSFATTITDDAVTLPKIADIADQTILGNNTGGASSPIALTAAQTKTILNLAGTNSGDVTLAGQNYLSIAGQAITANAVDLSGTHVTGTLDAARLGTFTGDVTSAGASYALTIANDAVTFAKFQNITDARLLGRSAGSAGDMQEVLVGAGLSLAAGTLSATGGGGTPGGADTQIQFNDAGAFGGMSLGAWNKTTTQLTLGSYSGTSNFITVQSSNAAGTAISVDSATGTGISLLTGASGTGILASSTGGLPLDMAVNDGVTNAATNIIRLTHNTTGTATSNFGARILARLESTTTADVEVGFLDFIWNVATHASRLPMFVIGTSFPGVAPAEKLRIYGNTVTQQVVAISAAGSSGSGIALIPNGSNAIMAAVPTGSAGGGNARGATSVDWQVTRSNATEVASGTGSNIPGGARNTASGSFSMAQGDTCTASGGFSLASGQQALASKYGQFSRSSAPAVTQGSQQMSIYTMSCVTTTTTPEELRLDGDSGTNRLTIANNQSIHFEILATGKRTTTQEVYIVRFTGDADKASTSASARIVGLVKTVLQNDSGTANIDVTADTTNGAIAITVTGTANGYTWCATVITTEVTV